MGTGSLSKADTGLTLRGHCRWSLLLLDSNGADRERLHLLMGGSAVNIGMGRIAGSNLGNTSPQPSTILLDVSTILVELMTEALEPDRLGPSPKLKLFLKH